MNDFKKLLSKENTVLFRKSENKSLSKILDLKLDELTVSKKTKINGPIWGESRYQFLRSSLFRKLSQDQQNTIYNDLSQKNMALSWYIERSGHNYGAKMILLSDTQEEKSLYALFCAEEAIHQREFENFMNFIPNPEKFWHPMLDPLCEAILNGEKETCFYTIQVLLEGFGMSYYSGLMETCRIEGLKNAYKRILEDEAKHHGTGVILANESNPSNLVKDQIFEYTRSFIKAFTNVNWMTSSLEKVKPLAENEIKRFYEEISYEDTVTHRLSMLKAMLSKVDNWGLIKRLEAEKAFF